MSNGPSSRQTDPLTIQQLVLKPLDPNPESYTPHNQLPTDDLKRNYALSFLDQQSLVTRAKIRVLSAYTYSQLPKPSNDPTPSPPASRSPSPPTTGRTPPAESPHSRPISPWLPTTSPHTPRTPHLHQQQKRQPTFQQTLQTTFKPTPAYPKPVVKRAANAGPSPYQQQQQQRQQRRDSVNNNSGAPFSFGTAPPASAPPDTFAATSRRGFGSTSNGTGPRAIESETVRLVRKTVRELDDFDRAVEKARAEFLAGIVTTNNGNGGGGGSGGGHTTPTVPPPPPGEPGQGQGQGQERPVRTESREGNDFRPDLDPRRR